MPRENKSEQERAAVNDPRRSQDEQDRESRQRGHDVDPAEQRSDDESRIAPPPAVAPRAPQPDHHRQQQR